MSSSMYISEYFGCQDERTVVHMYVIPGPPDVKPGNWPGDNVSSEDKEKREFVDFEKLQEGRGCTLEGR